MNKGMMFPVSIMPFLAPAVSRPFKVFTQISQIIFIPLLRRASKNHLLAGSAPGLTSKNPNRRNLR